jgi:hypothetical protein
LKYYSYHQLKEDAVNVRGLSNTHGRDEKCMKISIGKPERKYHLRDPDIDERIILVWIRNK